MTVRSSRPLLAALMLFGVPGIAQAGMPAVMLTDLARMRVQTLSFFLLTFLLCALVVRWAWNSLRADFPRLPRLSFGKAVGVMTLWGLLFVLVLTMISGARELMTPGAWTKQEDGLTYTLASAPPASVSAPEVDEGSRVLALERLRVLLWSYAEAHGGRFPTDREEPALPESAWRVADPSGMRFGYVGEMRVAEEGAPGRPLAFEPDLFDSPRLVLFTDGAIRRMTSDGLARALDADREPTR